MRRRAGTYVQQRARQLHWEYVRDRWWRFGLLALLLAAATYVVAHLAPGRARPYLVGASAASIFWYLTITVVIGSGSADWMHGLDGEQFTSDSLRRLRRRGWALIDDVPVPEIGNIDHVLVGPGGAYALESKHPRQMLSSAQLRDASAQARRAAERLHHLLATANIGLRIPVTPVLVVWGETPGDVETHDVKVVPGYDLRSWREALPSAQLTPEEVARAEAGLMAIVQVREEHRRRRDGAPPLVVEIGPFGILNQLTTGVGAGLAAWATAGVVLNALGGSGLVPVLGGISVIGLAAWRAQRVRILAVGWLAGVSALWLLLGGLYVADWIR